MQKTTTKKRQANVRKLRSLRAKYFRDLAALDAKFKADAKALGCIPAADAIRQLRDYSHRLMAHPVVKKYPKLAAQLQAITDAQVKKFKAKSF